MNQKSYAKLVANNKGDLIEKEEQDDASEPYDLEDRDRDESGDGRRKRPTAITNIPGGLGGSDALSRSRYGLATKAVGYASINEQRHQLPLP